MAERNTDPLEGIRRTIADLQSRQRESGDDHSAAIAVLQERLVQAGGILHSGAGATATHDGTAAGAGGVAVGGGVHDSVIVTGNGATISFGDQPIRMTAVQRESVLGRYLSHVISRTRYLQLRGIRSRGRLVNIELEQIYVTLKATRTRTLAAEEAWLAAERQRAPGEGHTLQHELRTETVTITVEEALAEHRHLVVLGDPGSGKTTLLRYLALCYARDRAEGRTFVADHLGLAESGVLPLLIPLRNLGAYLKKHDEHDGIEGHARVLDFLRASLQAERIAVSEEFFTTELEAGKVVILLGGMDEVGDADRRSRVARQIESLAAAYPLCRMIITSRIVGYSGAARLVGKEFTTTTIRDFTAPDVEQFLTQWHRLVAIGQMGPGDSAEQFAARQTQRLVKAITENARVRDLAINPLMLTVIALVHHDSVKLPERRAELYAEAVDVLLGKWDVAREIEDLPILEGQAFDTTDRRLLLQTLAFQMHEKGEKEIDGETLQAAVKHAFLGKTRASREAEQAAQRFLTVIRERTGLLVEAGPDVYRFSHLTFQEYLVAVLVAERDDFLSYTLTHTADPLWREVILLEAGVLSTKNHEKMNRLIRAIANAPREPELFHNLILAAECIRDVDASRVAKDIADTLTTRLRTELNTPLPRVTSGLGSWLGKLIGVSEKRRAGIHRRIAAANALSRIASGKFAAGSPYWSPPYGEPQWLPIPAGEFWLGSDDKDPLAFAAEKPLHRVLVPEFHIARTLVTNAQYALYVQATGAKTPDHWEHGQPPKGKLDHPVVRVSWHDAIAYCAWLSRRTGKLIALPSEAEWEKAARGDKDARIYPWGDTFDPVKCNNHELGLQDTTPVGVFLEGASPSGCLDMVGNVWEWTRSLWGKDFNKPDFPYPYDPTDGREQLEAGDDMARVLRGGSFWNSRRLVRCACRLARPPSARADGLGFRVVVRP